MSHLRCLLFFLAFALLRPFALAADTPPTDAAKARIFNVRDFGAVLDGKADDAPAIMAAFAAMKVNGHPFGTLLIPGVARIHTTLDLDGGYRNVTQEGQWSAGAGEVFRVVVDGALRPDAGIGTAVKLHGARCVWADIFIDKGGKASDIGLQVEDLDLADIGVTGTDFAGTLLFADATADKTKRIRSSKIHRVFASNCGQAIEWRGIEALGGFEFIWDRNCVNGSHFKDCADTAIQHFENFSPATQKIGLHFENCNMFSVGVLSLGDRAQEALVQITGGDFGSIQRIRVSGRPDKPSGDGSPEGLKLVDVHSISIDNLQTFRCRIGLHAIGSNCTVKRHQSMTGDVVPLVVEGSAENSAPRMDVCALYRNHHRQSVKILDSVTGGTLHFSGTIYDMNTDGVAENMYAIDCRSKEMLLDVSGLTQEHRNMLNGAIYSPTPANIRGVARAHLGNPLEHGAVTAATPALGAVLRNSSEQTLNLWVTVRYTPTKDAAANCTASLGPTAEKLEPITFADHAAATLAQTDTLYLRVPPWWSYRLAGVNVEVVRATEVRE